MFQRSREFVRELKLKHIFKHMHSVCASEIQRVWRGHRSRALESTNPDHGLVIAWKWASPLSSVHIAGTFSNWATWRMFWHSPKAEHRIFLPASVFGKRMSFSYKFVVDGAWVCDGSKEMAHDYMGNVNNIHRIVRPVSEANPQTPKKDVSNSKGKPASFPKLPSPPSIPTCDLSSSTNEARESPVHHDGTKEDAIINSHPSDIRKPVPTRLGNSSTVH